jgi:hypothetical protein
MALNALAVRAGQHNDVTVDVTDPEFAMLRRRIDQGALDDFDAQALGAIYSCVEITSQAGRPTGTTGFGQEPTFGGRLLGGRLP